jgi:ribonuclease inhibitor
MALHPKRSSALRIDVRALRIDVRALETREALHEALARAFRFPNYYGRNWDAFEECIRDVKVPLQVQVVGIDALRTRLPREGDLLRQCLSSFVAEDPRRHLEWLPD